MSSICLSEFAGVEFDPVLIIRRSYLVTSLISMGLYVTYLYVFSMAMWALSHRKDAKVSIYLRVILSMMFCVVTGQVLISWIWNTTEDVNSFSPRLDSTEYAFSLFYVVTPAVSGYLSDIVLAWRFCVIWQASKQARYSLALLLTGLLVVGVLNAFYDYCDAIWAWTSLMFNSAMTLAIISKIRTAALRSRRAASVTRALIESSALASLGLLAAATVFTYKWLRGYDWDTTPSESMILTKHIALCVSQMLPIIFGISHALVIGRVGIVQYLRSREGAVTQTAIVFPTVRGDADFDTEPETGIAIRLASLIAKPEDEPHVGAERW